jgi:hypothetical protein
VIYEAAGDSSPEGDDAEPVDLDWERGGNLNRCREPGDVDAAFDRGEEHVGVALIALVYNNPDTDKVLPRVARGLRSPNPETRRQSLLALMHTARLHGRVDAITLELLHGLLYDHTPISVGSRYEVRGTATQTVGDLQAFLPAELLPAWVNQFTDYRRFRMPTASRPAQGTDGRWRGQRGRRAVRDGGAGCAAAGARSRRW